MLAQRAVASDTCVQLFEFSHLQQVSFFTTWCREYRNKNKCPILYMTTLESCKWQLDQLRTTRVAIYDRRAVTYKIDQRDGHIDKIFISKTTVQPILLLHGFVKIAYRCTYQCDQMAKLFFNIGPFITMKICPKAQQFPKDGLKLYQILI